MNKSDEGSFLCDTATRLSLIITQIYNCKCAIFLYLRIWNGVLLREISMNLTSYYVRPSLGLVVMSPTNQLI
jgi:hypothetical protein